MRTIITTGIYNGYKLSEAKNSEGHYQEIVQSIESLLTHMIQKHKNVFVINFVVKYPAGFDCPDDNSLFLKFLEALSLHCRRRNYDPKYIWVRESSKTGRPHWHVLYTFDHNRIWRAHGVIYKALELWARCLNLLDAKGLIYLCTSGENEDRYGGLKISQNDPDAFSFCMYWASYLAKAFSKFYVHSYVNQYGMSRLD